jgi:hypothetical protein
LHSFEILWRGTALWYPPPDELVRMASDSEALHAKGEVLTDCAVKTTFASWNGSLTSITKKPKIWMLLLHLCVLCIFSFVSFLIFLTFPF